MRRAPIQFLLLSLLLVSCASASANAQSEEPKLRVTTENADDQVEIRYENGAAQIEVHSPSGIGSAAFELESGRMPEEIVLHLHLAGLEEFRITSSKESIFASVSSGDSSHIEQHLLSSGTELPLPPLHPSRMKIEIVSEQPEKTIPLEEGYFQITLPKEFLQHAASSFTVEWIDFYR